MSSINSFQNKRKRRGRKNKTVACVSQSLSTMSSVPDFDYNDLSCSFTFSHLSFPPLTSFSDDEIIFKSQKYSRTLKMLEGSFLDFLNEDEKEQSTASSSLEQISQNMQMKSRHGYDVQDDLFDSDFENSPQFSKTAKSSSIDFNIWKEGSSTSTNTHPRIHSILSQESFAEEIANPSPVKSPIPRRSSPLIE